MRCSVIKRKISRRIEKMRLCPIEVFVFHAVTDEYDEALNMRVDWTATEEFKRNIVDYQSQYTFISLTEAYKKLKKDCIRRKKYAVLTCDDGFESVLGILPFLEERQIPVTLFVNPKYLDGESKREGYSQSPRYIADRDLTRLQSKDIEIGMHGYEHLDATKQSLEEFSESVDRCVSTLGNHPRYIPFFAYTWGNYSDLTQQILKEKNIIPVLTDGQGNCRYKGGIGRKPIDSYYLKKRR